MVCYHVPEDYHVYRSRQRGFKIKQTTTFACAAGSLIWKVFEYTWFGIYLIQLPTYSLQTASEKKLLLHKRTYSETIFGNSFHTFLREFVDLKVQSTFISCYIN